MTSTSSDPSLWTFNFCYNTQAHPGCIQQPGPKQIKGVKPKNSVGRLLNKFCKKTKLDSEDLEIHKCLCYEPNNGADQDTLLDLPMKLSSSRKGLTSGGFLFVRRVEKMEMEQEDDEDESAAQSDLDSTKPPLASEVTQGKEGSSPKTRKAKDANSRIAISREETIKWLGGDSFLSRNGLKLPFSGAVGISYWENILKATKIAVRMTPDSERQKDGLFPSILIQSVNHCIKDRERRIRQIATKVGRADFKAAVEMMRSQAVLEMGRNDPIFCHSDEVEELTPSLHASRWSLASKISELWGNTSWKKQRLRSDLGPIALRAIHVMQPLYRMAELTAVEEEKHSSSIGFPPLVLRALREALVRDEALVSKGQLRPNAPSSGWPQDRVVKAALLILQSYLESKGSAAQIASSSQVESNASSLPSHSSSSQPSIQTQLADLKTKKNTQIIRSIAHGRRKEKGQEAIQEGKEASQERIDGELKRRKRRSSKSWKVEGRRRKVESWKVERSQIESSFNQSFL